jgi:NifU-like protein involved in Fe-S cluster formation
VRDHFENPRGLPASKMHCSVLAADTMRAAAADYRGRTSS